MPIDHNNLRRLDLNLLLAFDALMRSESVSGAAERLSLGQPAMSHNLRRLRDLFEDPILLREGGQLRPTDRGLALWAPVRDALEGLETGLDMARAFDPTASKRVFRISVPDYLAASVLSHLTALTEDAAGIQYRIESFDREPGRDALVAGQLDAYIGVMPTTASLVEEHLLEDDFVTLYDPKHWPAPPETLAKFCAAPHLLVAQIDSFEGWVDTALQDHGLSRNVVASVSRFGDAVATLPGTAMLATLPRKAAETRLVHGLAFCDPPVGQRRFTVGLYRRRRALGAPASEWLADQIKNCLSTG